MYIFKDNRKKAIQNAFYYETFKNSIMQFNSDAPQKLSYSREQDWFFIVGFNLLQSMVPHFILLYFFICVPPESKLRFT